MTITNKRLLTLPAVALGLTLTLAACGSSGGHDMGSMSTPAAGAPATPASSTTPPGSESPAAGPHNEADVAFAQGMIPHHVQAVEMAEMVLAKKDISPKVTDLAQRIKDAQAPEISKMRGWLAGWGENPSPAMGGHSEHGGGGMMDQADMDALQAANGAEATKLFLSGMVKHHQGAVAMAQTEIDEGENPDAKKLAQAIIDTQNAEIEEMKQLGAS